MSDIKRNQYICCYDIENSVIYEVAWNYNGKKYHLCKKMTKKIENELTGTHRGYFTNEEKKRVENILLIVNSIYKTKYELITFTEKYLSNFYIKNPDNSISSKFARSPEEDNQIFNELIELWKNGADVLFTAHNLDYEYSYIRTNTNFLQTLCKYSDSPKIIAENTSHIKCIDFVSAQDSHFIIKDTLLMTNKAIKTLGDEFNLPKLDYEYDVFRSCSDTLTDLDYKYNRRDNEIAMAAIEQLQRQIPQYSDITKIPISATHHAKNICKYNPNVNKKVGKTKLDQKHKMFAKFFNLPTLELYQNFFNASGGGLIFVNPKFTGRFISNVKSFDIKSAHPSQFYNKRFPQGDTINEINPDGLIDLFFELARKMKKSPKNFYNNYNPIKDYLLYIEFEELSAVELPNQNIILSLGSGRQITSGNENVKTNRMAINIEPITKNGKTVKSKKYKKWLYGIDLIYHLTFYKAKSYKILKCYKYKLVPCSDYIISKSDYYADKKELYKKFKIFSKNNNFDDTKNFVINSGAEEYTIKGLNDKDYVQFLDIELLRIKGIFNGLFGQEYQNIIHDDLYFTDNFEIDSNPLSKIDYDEILKKTSVHYTVGAYTAAWSRLELACVIWHCINNGGTILYGATDSIKAINISENLFEKWCLEHDNKWYSHNKYNFGAVDYEEKYDLFYVAETLKNIGIINKNSKIHISFTISGFKADVYFKSIIDKYEGKEYTTRNINKLTKELFISLQPQTIPKELTGKKIRNKKFLGIKSLLGQINFGALEEIEYELLGG